MGSGEGSAPWRCEAGGVSPASTPSGVGTCAKLAPSGADPSVGVGTQAGPSGAVLLMGRPACLVGVLAVREGVPELG